MEDIILENKPKLVKWLSSHSDILLQHVQAKKLITKLQYSELMDVTGKERVVIKLLDIVLGKGENVCREFLDLLKEDNVNEKSPELRDWIKTMDTKGKISASGGSSVYAPTITGAILGPIEMNVTAATSGKSDELGYCKISTSSGSRVYAPTIIGARLDPTVEPSGKSDVSTSCQISASCGSSVYAPTITGAILGSIEMNMTFAPPDKSDAPGNY